MTIKEIKDLTKFLTDEEVDKIKKEIKSKENVLKSENMEEEEMVQVLNTLFAILVIEKTLESEIEGIEDLRAELEQELLESYEIYDSHMLKYKKEEKKKKKRWLLDFLFLSDRIHSQKNGIGASNKAINKLKGELNALKQQKSNDNLKAMVRNRDARFKDFYRIPKECRNPHHHHDSLIDKIRCEKRKEKFIKDVIGGKISRQNSLRVRNSHNHHHEADNVRVVAVGTLGTSREEERFREAKSKEMEGRNYQNNSKRRV